MNPSFHEDAQAAVAGEPRWLRVGRLLWRVLGLLFTDIFGRKKSPLRVDKGRRFSRFLRGLLYRMMFIPVLIAIIVTVLVAVGTHPQGSAPVTDPASQGIYYDPVDFLAADDTHLEGWLIPVMDARRVLLEKDGLLHKRYPAIVLVHDFGASRQQMLPMIMPLHEAGYVLMVVNLRGAWPSKTGCTFGINEAQDVRAAIELLRRRPFVDPDAIGVLGVGTGATAALLAAHQDARLQTLILDHPVRQFDDLLLDKIGPRQTWLGWVRPFSKWAFEISYKVDSDEVNLDRFAELMRSRSCLLLDDDSESMSFTKPVRQQQIVDFLGKRLVAKPRTASLLPRQPLGQVDAQPLDGPADSMPAPATGESWPPQRSANDLLPPSAR